MIIVLRAGGVGSRLWPVSREHNPKQFHALTSERTMLQEAYDRLEGLVAPEEIYVSTSFALQDRIRVQLPSVDRAHMILEPARKDTAAAIGLESIIIDHAHPGAVVASLGSDHSVKDAREFQEVLRAAEQYVQAHPEYIVPIGIEPTNPDTGYGYIQCGAVLETVHARPIFQVTRFTEKPQEADAKRFLSEGSYLWNANMFVWNVATILNLYKQHMPEMYDQLQSIKQSLGTPEQERVIAETYPQMQKIAIDYAIIEKAESIAALSADIGWSDIGDWARLKDELAQTEMENVSIDANHVALKTHNTLVYTTKKGKTIATIGLDHLIIIDTEDALLVCDKYDSQQVKDVVELLSKQRKSDIL